MTWIPLHVHSQYSILDSTASIKNIVKKAEEYQFSSIALTDHGNLFGAVEFYKACKSKEIQPLLGCELYVAPQSRFDKMKIIGEKHAYSIVLLAKNRKGYRNLCKLSSLGYTEGFYYYPRVDKELLKEYSEGLICFIGGLGSQLAQIALSKEGEERFFQEVKWYQELYGEDFYLELQRQLMTEDEIESDKMHQETWVYQKYHSYIEQQEKVNQIFVSGAKDLKIPYIATADSHYMERSDWKAHEILLNVQSGEPCEIWEKDNLGKPKFRIPNPKRRTYASHSLEFKSKEQMQALFEDLPEALSTTLEIRKKCSLELDFETKHYPVYVPPSLEGEKYTEKDRIQSVNQYLKQLCQENIPQRYTKEKTDLLQRKFPEKKPLKIIENRLKYELEIICSKGLTDYLLIVWDFIHWAKNRGIPMGPGRGSGAGSIILYLIGITDIEPLRFDLFFERFINPERLSYPDIDVDICMDRRDDVIQYTLNKYGNDNVAQIITFGTMKAKMAIKDVGRVLSVPLPQVNAIAKLVPDDLNITIDKALDIDIDLAQLYAEDADARRVLTLAKQLEGSIRNTGIHAAGVIISGELLTDHIPTCKAKDSQMNLTQYSMKPVEAVGMLKVDFLGLKTLTSIQKCVDAIQDKYGEKIDWVNLPLEDRKTFDLFNQGKTLGVFQIESSGMQELARQLHLDCFEEIIAVVSLYRPGPMDMIPSFISRKHGREPIEYDHEWMEEILKETYGIMVYQEQVMQIAQKLANYSLGQGDVLRRAMGKKDLEQMAQERTRFCQGALKNGISEPLATRIFDKMEKFASYGFNKSHAAAYAYVSYVTAYLKANYPGQWMAALMTCDRHDLSKVSKFIREAQSMKLSILPPDINESGIDFVATDHGIRFALAGIKGVGSGVVEAILEERKKDGRYTSLYQFIQRINPKKVGKKVIEQLIWAGCCDFTRWTREEMVHSVEKMHTSAIKEKKETQAGVITMFALMGDSNEERFKTPPSISSNFSKLDLLFKEKELLGFFLTGHPMDLYQTILQKLSCVAFEQIHEMAQGTVFRAACIVESVHVRVASKTQRKFAILTISDGMESFELPIWPELYEKKGELLKENHLLYTVLVIEKNDEGVKLGCKWFDLLAQVDEKMIHSCDEAFDKAKFRLERTAFMKAKQQVRSKMEKQEEVRKEIEKCKLSICASQTKLSEILKMKQIFHDFPGESPIELSFLYENCTIATLYPENGWKVKLSDEFKKKIRQFSSIKIEG